jgi:prophage regulatory protein
MLNPSDHYSAKETPMSTDTPDRILRLPTVLSLTGLCRSTLYRKVDAGKFPRQIRIAERCVGWRESAVKDWMRNPIFYEVGDEAG